MKMNSSGASQTTKGIEVNVEFNRDRRWIGGGGGGGAGEREGETEGEKLINFRLLKN